MPIESEIRRGWTKFCGTLLMLKHKNELILANAFSVSQTASAFSRAAEPELKFQALAPAPDI